MKVEVHMLRYGDDWLVPYVIRHYLTFAEKVVIHDAGGGAPIRSNRELEVIPWDCPR